MKNKWILSIGLLVILLLALAVGTSLAQGPGPQGVAATVGTAFTYQGRLLRSGTPVDDTCDFRFTLWDAQSGGSQVGSALDKAGVSVSEGLFAVQLDFGGDAFQGDARWLQVEVKCGSDTDYTDLGRQPITPAPYALALPGLRIQQNDTSPNIIGGHKRNSVAAGVVGATIGGGADPWEPNWVTGDFGTVSGGGDNTAGAYAAVGGGWGNVADRFAAVGGGGGNTASGDFATVGGGKGNTASGTGAFVGGGGIRQQPGGFLRNPNVASGDVSVVSGGFGNTASGPAATVGGGYDNAASGGYATVGGGLGNGASYAYTTVSGGSSNTASNSYATVGGGSNNTASGQYATVPGGLLNTASGDYSFAAGHRAKADKLGCFVWADSTNEDFTCSWDNQFRVRATGGATFLVQVSPDWQWVKFKVESGRLINTSTGAYLSTGGVWTNASDRNAKENFEPVDSQAILEEVAQLPISTWNYKAEDDSIRHIGPTAQDFYAAFGLGADDKHIASLDASGVALAAIQGLYAQVQELRAENAALQARVDDLEARLEALEARSPAPVQSGLLWPGVTLGVLGLAWVARRRRGEEGGR